MQGEMPMMSRMMGEMSGMMKQMSERMGRGMKNTQQISYDGNGVL